MAVKDYLNRLRVEDPPQIWVHHSMGYASRPYKKKKTSRALAITSLLPNCKLNKTSCLLKLLPPCLPHHAGLYPQWAKINPSLSLNGFCQLHDQSKKSSDRPQSRTDNVKQAQELLKQRTNASTVKKRCSQDKGLHTTLWTSPGIKEQSDLCSEESLSAYSWKLNSICPLGTITDIPHRIFA